MRFALQLEPQLGLDYEDHLVIARRSEAAGLEALFRSDHYQSFPGDDHGPTTDAWAVIAGLARETSRIRLGTLVSPVTFRLPGEFAKVVTTVDHMSNGRVEVALGTGWHESEHDRYGFPFPPIAVRAAMLEEQLAILRGFWTQPDGWRFDGQHYRIRDAVFEPKPVQRPHPPIIVGGSGSSRSIALAARYGDELNMLETGPSDFRERVRRLVEACERIDRDPGDVTRSAMVRVLIGPDPAAVRKRASTLLERIAPGEDVEAWLRTVRVDGIVGTYDEARARCRDYAEAGCQRIMLQDHLADDLEMIDEIGRELVEQV